MPAHLASVLCQGLGETADRQTEMVPELLEFPSGHEGRVGGTVEKSAGQECCRALGCVLKLTKQEGERVMRVNRVDDFG